MKGILKKQGTMKALAALLLLGMTAVTCTSAYLPDTEPTVETFTPTSLFTPLPTATNTEVPVTPVPTNEPAPFTSVEHVFVSGVSHTGGNIYGTPDDLFHTFTVPPDELVAFRFDLLIVSYRNNKSELTPTPTALPTGDWRLRLFRYRTDGDYTGQPARVPAPDLGVVEVEFLTELFPFAGMLQQHLTAEVSMQTLQERFGDCSAFTYQVLEAQEVMQQQGYFSINPSLLFSSGGGLVGSLEQGITLGYPYSWNERETEFFHQGRFIVIQEPGSGFYRLDYLFNFTSATGLHGIEALQKLAGELSVRMVPCGEDGHPSDQDPMILVGGLVNGTVFYRVQLPIDAFRQNAGTHDRYLLRVVDRDGKVMREEYFLYLPHEQ